MTALCYLAAGSAKRFGENKLLYLINGKPMYSYGLSVLSELKNREKDCRLLVISRYQPILDAAVKCGAETVFCPESENGISFTIRAALTALGKILPCDRLLFMAADQPFITVPTVRRLLETGEMLSDTLAGDKPLAACASFEELHGNPVLFSGVLAARFSALTGDFGGKTVLRDFPGRCLYVHAENRGELADVDVPQDLMKNLTNNEK